jgi:hypothetical protein
MSGIVGYGNDLIRIISGADTSNTKEWTFDLDGNIQLPFGGNVLDYNGNVIISEGTGNITFSADTINNNVQLNPIVLRTHGVDSTYYTWTFDSDGSLTIPDVGVINQNNSVTKTTTADITTSTPTIIWTSNSSTISSAKLVIQLEQEQVGDPTGFHTHSCEAIIAARGAIQSGLPSISIYGIVYTSTGSLVTLSTQRNVSSGVIEVVATLADTTNPAYVSIHSIESTTRGL